MSHLDFSEVMQTQEKAILFLLSKRLLKCYPIGGQTTIWKIGFLVIMENVLS